MRDLSRSYGQAQQTASEDCPKELFDGESPSLPQIADDVDTVFVPVENGEQPGHITAEGFKKLGYFSSFCRTIASPVSQEHCFWDEPESNVNPTLMRLIVEVLLDMSRNGQQIVLATMTMFV